MLALRKNAWKASILNQTERYSEKLQIPDFLFLENGQVDNEAMLNLLLKEEYGIVKTEGVSVVMREVESKNDSLGGKVVEKTLEVEFSKGEQKFSFQLSLFIVQKIENAPLILQIDFFKEVPNKYCPIEELIDQGVSIAHVYYKDITTDDGDFSTGIAPMLTDRKREDSAGKIAIWAYSLTKIAQCLIENNYAIKGRLFLAGHSRLGKTALLAAAQCEFFSGVLSNCSGCGGAAIYREKQGEDIEKIMKVFPYWFCPGFSKYVNRENELPFDQHYLLALIAPRKLCVSTAKEDVWADTDAQHLAVQLADEVYEKQGAVGLKSGKILEYGQSDEGGKICFLKRFGEHFFTIDDWKFFIRNIKKGIK